MSSKTITFNNDVIEVIPENLEKGIIQSFKVSLRHENDSFVGTLKFYGAKSLDYITGIYNIMYTDDFALVVFVFSDERREEVRLRNENISTKQKRISMYRQQTQSPKSYNYKRGSSKIFQGDQTSQTESTKPISYSSSTHETPRFSQSNKFPEEIRESNSFVKLDQITKISQQIQMLNDAIKTHHNMFKQIQSKLDGLDKEQNEHTKILNDLQDTINEQKDTIKTMVRVCDNIRTKSSKSTDSIDKIVKTLNEKVIQIEPKVEQVNSQVITLTNNFKQLDEVVQQTKKETVVFNMQYYEDINKLQSVQLQLQNDVMSVSEKLRSIEQPNQHIITESNQIMPQEKESNDEIINKSTSKSETKALTVEQSKQIRTQSPSVPTKTTEVCRGIPNENLKNYVFIFTNFLDLITQLQKKLEKFTVVEFWDGVKRNLIPKFIILVDGQMVQLNKAAIQSLYPSTNLVVATPSLTNDPTIIQFEDMQSIGDILIEEIME
ncbi:Spindle assembly checkpoint component MAD1 [Entamoeba marina]